MFKTPGLLLMQQPRFLSGINNPYRTYKTYKTYKTYLAQHPILFFFFLSLTNLPLCVILFQQE